jgi:hypothetical protein
MKLSAYRKKTDRGRAYAVVDLPDSETKRRRAFYLGEFGTPESHAAYLRLLADWQARGRRLPDADPAQPSPPPASGPTVGDVSERFWEDAAQMYTHKRRNGLRSGHN